MNNKNFTLQAKEQRFALGPFFGALVIGLLILLFFSPIIQWEYKVVPDIPLAGVEATQAALPVFKYSDWLTGKYQKRLETAFTKLNGLRNFGIRLDNQINFSLFRECKSYGGSIAVGKDNWLFEKAYINNMNNDTPVDLPGLEARISEMKQLQDLLEARGIYFIFLITPSKATVYGEYLPEKYIKHSLVRTTPQYANTRRLIDTHGINYMDAHEFFMENKTTAPYDLFVRSGTHWSYYGASLFSMALASRITQDTGLPLGSISCESIRVDSLPLGTDGDIASLMNVFDMTATCREMAHPTMKTTFPPDPVRPDVLLVGDSFLQTLNVFMCDPLFGTRDYYFYYRRNIPRPFSKDRETIPMNEQLKEAILNKKIIIIGNNEVYLNTIGFGFIKEAIRALQPRDPNGPTESRYLTQTQVSQLYVSIFGRASEGKGNTYWGKSQRDVAMVADMMLATGAAKMYFRTWLNDNQKFIELIYKNTLGKTRVEDPDGINYWTNQLERGKSKGQVIAALINAVMDPAYKGLPAQNRFINKVTASNYCADKIATCPDQNALSAFVEFISGVTEDPATVVAAKAAVDKG